MIRNFKTLGLALVAALGIVALAANAVSANPATAKFHAGNAHSSLTGTQEVRNTFSVNAGTIHCQTAQFEGTASSSTPADLTIAPTYKTCLLTTVTLETLEAVVDMNGCHYLFTPSGQVHLTCAPEKFIRVTAPLCNVTVHPQTVEKVDYKNVGAGAEESVTVTSTATGLAYTQSSLCPGGGGGSFNNGSYAGAVTTTCTETLGKRTACWWTTA